ncbi:S-layer homology domain-containing protein [Brevibacillus porteri]|uniref:Middle cell wall protein n=1 Tax=Brevibacillus porteri TaxID=2126350 RepID=A0ABX5FHX7_9BACL|nr:S-layer homology domain-containing protein [Brevibacillus porteri]MED1798193.1 S-layer homology domain-containing protein [Brevibacillus porteri]MED2133874.1 S-layer homology domain-containing protein [Brevibacillus porteri]MED2743248.1 S-layer homology domain-containing protein [Brevibacillus porteri]MED2815418.1 S-layer homology domain-containing protein [Brevibacillus porteri]MED2892192.1 S-layer homology domain-containing protein [Brevibacillus porteri]
MKKVVNSVLASALALTVAPMAFAAEEAATTTAPKMDAEMEKTVKRLEALGLVAGYGNGEYGVDKTITRAEFATLIVRARGLEQGAKLAQFSNTYTDVKSSDWFAGFVNVASGEEIVKGFPDKSFKPQNQVTYAEAVTMIVRALGYEPAVKGVWPNSMISKASELNIARSITSPNNAAVRGDIFKMLDNALRVDLMERKGYGTEATYEVTKENLLTKYLKVTVRDMEWAQEAGRDGDDLPLVTNVPAIGLGKIKANEVTLNGKDAGIGNTTFKVADGINSNEFAGQHVQVWIKDDREDVIVWMEGSTDEEVIMDRVSEWQLKGKTFTDTKELSSSDLKDLKLVLDASEKSYRLNKDTVVTYNFKRYTDAVDGLKEIIKDGDGFTFGVKVVLDDNNEIAYMHVIDDQTMNQTDEGRKYGSEVISKVDVEKKKITNIDNDKFNELENKDEGKDFLVFLNGKPAKFSDLKENMVYSVYYPEGDEDKFLIFATDTIVEGKVDKVVMRSSSDYRLTVGDKTYRVYKGATYSDNGNKDVEDTDGSNWDLIKGLDGETVKLYLDASGRVRHVTTKDPIDDRKQKAIVTRAAYHDYGKNRYQFTVLTQKGKKHEVDLKADDIYDVNGKNFDKNGNAGELEDLLQPKKDDSNVLLEVELNKDGKVDKVRILKTDLIRSSGADWNKLADEDDEMVDDYEVNDDTAIFDMTGEIKDANKQLPELKNAKTTKFKNIADEDDLTVYYTVDENKDEVEAIFVVDGSGLVGDSKYGMVVSYGKSGGDDTIVVLTKEGDKVEEKTYTLDKDSDDLRDDRGIKRGDFIAFQLDTNDEVVVDDVVEVVNNNLQDDEEKMLAKIADEKEWKDASIDKMKVGLVSNVDGNTITLKDAKDKKSTINTKSSTAFMDIFDDLEGVDGVSKGDYIVAIDSSDISGNKYDYVLIISDEDEVDKEGWEKQAEAFLKQEPDKDPGEDKWDAIPSNVTGKKFPLGNFNMYQVNVPINDGKKSEIETVVLSIGGKTVDGEVKGEEIVFQTQGSFDVDSATVTVTNAKGDKDTANVTFKK